MERLKNLLAQKSEDLEPWLRGYIPKHYKRLSIPMKEAKRLAEYGAWRIIETFHGDVLYFTQALIAGAILSREFDTITICTPSQYGKSWTLGRVGIVKAIDGRNTYVAAATGDLTHIIMGHLFEAAQDAVPEVKKRIAGVEIDEIQRLGKTLSKKKVSVVDGGFVEAISLADTLSDKTRSGAMGRGDDYMADEAALISEKAFGEIGRRDFAGIDGTRNQLVMISNPHKPGYFYNHLTEEHPDERSLIVWADALTAVEEGEFTEEQVLASDFAKDPSSRTRYLMCELETMAYSMFDDPIIDNSPHEGIHFLGVDSAYKGKDNITLCHVIFDDGHFHVQEIITLDKSGWVEGQTQNDIIQQIKRVYNYYRVPLMCVDVGQGIWLNGGLVNAGVNSRGIQFGSGATDERKKANQYAAVSATNMRAEMHLDLQDLMQTRHVTFTEQAYNAVKEVFPRVSMERKANGKVQIRPKIEITNEIGHSPDAFDSLLLAIHAVILYNAEN